MKIRKEFFAGAALAALMAVSPAALAQESGSMQVGGTTVTVGGGTAILTLPDVEFTKRYINGVVSDRQKNSDDFGDEIGANINGSIATTMGAGNTVSLNGFWVSISDDDNSVCEQSAGAIAICRWAPLVDNPNISQVFALPLTNLSAERDVDQWGVSLENAWNLTPNVMGVTQAPNRRYVALGADIRGIDQDLSIIGVTATLNSPATYNEELDTRYYGAYAAWGGTYTPFLFRGLWNRLGLQSSIRVQGGVYYADTDYSGVIGGPFTANTVTGALSLSTDDVAFIGGVKLETSKRLGPRASLSLKSEYEYYSWVPDMRYNDVDVGGGNSGPNNGTSIGNDDAFSARTSLRLTIKLGPREIMEPYK